MKVLYVCTRGLKDAQTGAGTQARETYNALVRLGCEMTRIYSCHPVGTFEDEEGRALTEDEVRVLIAQNDVTHLIYCSRPLAQYWRRFTPHRPTVGSTVFWSGWERVWIARQNTPFGWERIHSELAGIRQLCACGNDFRGIDVFLPNTHAEGQKVRTSFRMDKTARCVPVPNGFIPPRFDVASLPRSKKVPDEDYLVVPGVFAGRKNQLGLIRALRETNYPVVFMGSAVNNWESSQAFYAKCREEATENMHFIGYLPSGSEEYWQVLAHARCACLPSDCETPGIAMIEAAYAGARPVITKFGGTLEYYGFDAEYFNPCRLNEMREAVDRGWARGRLSTDQAKTYARFSWDYCAEITRDAYRVAILQEKSESENQRPDSSR